jgi:hypothetical protein
MAKAYCGERISEHLIRDNAGFLVAISQPIARSGWQPYKMSEIDPTSGDDSMVQVYRPPEEVTSAATVASAEGKPITMRHPPKFLDSNTVGWSSRGHIQNVRVGPRDKDGNVTLVADLHIHDGSLIDQILSKNLRDISMGYTYDADDGPREGTLAQRNIRMNHCAVVEAGRAGTTYITDANEDKENMDNAKMDRLCDLLEKLLNTRGDGKDRTPRGQEDELPGVSTGQAIAEGRPGEAAENIGEGVSEVASEVASGVANAAMEDDDPEAEYELAAGPQRKLKGFRDLIPITGKGGEGNINPVSARDALERLADPSLRAVIKAGGKKMIDSYNSTVRQLQAQIRAGGGRRSLAVDTRSRRQADAASFERSAARYHGKAIQLHQEPNTVEDDHRAEDAAGHSETFDEAVERVRQEQIERWTPKKRR